MRKYLLAGAAALVIATPAAATTDNAGYIGLEGGILFPKAQDITGSIDFTDPAILDVAPGTIGRVRYKAGADVDVIGGYDFGMFRLEGELGYKRAKARRFTVLEPFVTSLNTRAGTAFTSTPSAPKTTLNGLLTVAWLSGWMK